MASIQEDLPAEDADKLFSDNGGFNKNVSIVFRLKEPLTWRQWKKLIKLANANVGEKLNTSGHIDWLDVFTDVAAFAVHQILVMYGSSYGGSKAANKLNNRTEKAKVLGEASMFADAVVKKLLAADKSQKGRYESLTSAAIRKAYSPAQVTAHINQVIKMMLHEHNERMNTTKTLVNPLAMVQEDAAGIQVVARTPGPDVWKRMRSQELLKNFLASIYEALLKKAATEDDAADRQNYQLMVNLLGLYFDPENQHLINERTTFTSQCVALHSGLNISQFAARKLAADLIDFVRAELNLVVVPRTIRQLEVDSTGGAAARRKKGKSHSYSKGTKNCYRERQIVEVLEGAAYDIDEGDYDLLIDALGANKKMALA